MFDKLQKVKNKENPENKFSIIIPTWNNLDYLKLCLSSIEKNSKFKHQIIILVNEGSDGTTDWLSKQIKYDYVLSPQNIGICYGLNICRPMVSANHILYLNDDMYVLPNWDLELWKEIELIGHNKFMLSSTMIEPHNTNNKCVIVADYGDDLKTFQEEKLLKDFNTFQKNDWNGSTWPPNIMHVDTWDLIGGMSTEFSPGMYSDPDFSMKLWQAGFRLLKGVSRSRVYHFGSKSTGRIKKNKGKKTFINKWGITPRLFTEKYLKRGEDFKGPLLDYHINTNEKIVSFFKKMF